MSGGERGFGLDPLFGSRVAEAQPVGVQRLAADQHLVLARRADPGTRSESFNWSRPP